MSHLMIGHNVEMIIINLTSEVIWSTEWSLSLQNYFLPHLEKCEESRLSDTCVSCWMGVKLKRWSCNHVGKRKRRNSKALRVHSHLMKCQELSLFNTSVHCLAAGINFMMKVEDSIRQWKLLGLACQEFVMRVEVVLLTFQAFWCVTLCHWVSVFLTFLRIVVPSSAKVKQYKEKSYWTLDFWRWRQNDPSKPWEPITQQHGITSKKTLI